MIEGFARVAAVTPEVKVGDCFYNAARIEAAAREVAALGARVICFPELSITGYTCGDLFLQDTLLNRAKDALLRLVRGSEGRDEIVIAGLPFRYGEKLYNAAAVYGDGILHGLVPKSFIPNYGEFYELRHFTPAENMPNGFVTFDAGAGREGEDRSLAQGARLSPDERSARASSEAEYDRGGLYAGYDESEGYVFDDIPFGTAQLFVCEEDPELVFAAEICEDLWVPDPPSGRHARAGARIIFNLSAGNETVGKAAYRRSLVSGQSGRLICGYVYANAGFGESSSDAVFSGHSMIGENGAILAESAPFRSNCAAEGLRPSDGIALRSSRIAESDERTRPRGDIAILADIDLLGLAHDRRYRNTYRPYDLSELEYEISFFSQNRRSREGARQNGKVVSINKIKAADASGLMRRVDPHPFVPSNPKERAERCEDILNMQASGLAKRLLCSGAETAIIGVSGGLDSTLALLASTRAAEMAGMPPESVVAVTMPGFGTTGTTKGNARRLCEAVGIALSEIDIRKVAEEHLGSIGHSVSDHDTVFENAQARIRTMTLMDIANQRRGIAVGTGDLSESALGWATYNGDHMSMYGVNAGVPKTLVRHIIRYVADANPALTDVLSDILDTPVSPELLPPDEGGISQKTEEIIGPYELHDFFLYHMIRWGRAPGVIRKLAKIAFSGANCERNAAFSEKTNQSADHRQEAICDDSVSRFDAETIDRWLKVFYRRFFANQFKRNAVPDGPKIGSVSLSPRGDWRMPSDAEVRMWLDELE
ncbi:MAG: NAD(+) synthase [Clostridiales Family XIII bacterium]|jgi:NAD+ synthase (glutamine-hydrolysing)|nr:NAD(+) synthase [Clostridiales Family XIII bacterium]